MAAGRRGSGCKVGQYMTVTFPGGKTWKGVRYTCHRTQSAAVKKLRAIHQAGKRSGFWTKRVV